MSRYKRIKTRCEWAESDPLTRDYHDKEWGVPIRNDQKLFEFLILEGMQAGLSWSTILKKRENIRKAFDGFDALKISEYDENKIQELLSNKGIIRNRRKIEAAIQNARVYLAIKKEFGSFNTFIWRFVGGEPKINAWKKLEEIPVNTPESDNMSENLVKRGFKFVGSTICYAFMQAVGMVNDHIVHCVRYREVMKERFQSNKSLQR